MQPLLGNQRPDLLISLMNMSLVLRLPREMHLFKCPTPAERFWNCYKTLTFYSLLTRCRIPCACHAKQHLNVRKRASEHVVFCSILTWKCASRHNSVHFLDISTSKNGPRADVLCTFWLKNVLRATMACTSSTSQLLKVVRGWGAFYILTSKCASRYNRVQFFISHLASWLRTRRFSEPTFRPAGATNHWKYTVFRAFSTFSRTCIFFLLTLSLLWSSLFFSDSSHLCFSSCPYCRKFDF